MPLSLSSSAILVALGIIPSFVWLLFYLREDCHPEPKKLVISTFLMGIIVAPLAVIFQLGFIKIAEVFSLPIAYQGGGVIFFFWAAFIEELVKFYAVWLIVLRNPEFDEPVDAMIYMITAALGFAAIENILVMFRIIPDGPSTTFMTWGLRSFGATILHALSSGILGYFLAMSWFFRNHRTKLIFSGLMVATVFHFTFNILLSASENKLAGLGFSTALLIVMASLIALLFDRIKERHGTNFVSDSKNRITSA